MSNESWLTIIAVFLSPIIPVLISLWIQNRKEKIQARKGLFMLLISHRGDIPVSHEFVKALNGIDVVFHGENNVISAWHRYFDLLGDYVKNKAEADRAKLDLFHAIAQSLGYRDVKQTDMDKFYYPAAHWDQQVEWQEIRADLKAFLRNSNAFYQIVFDNQKKESEKSQTDESNNETP